MSYAKGGHKRGDLPIMQSRYPVSSQLASTSKTTRSLYVELHTSIVSNTKPPVEKLEQTRCHSFPAASLFFKRVLRFSHSPLLPSPWFVDRDLGMHSSVIASRIVIERGLPQPRSLVLQLFILYWNR